MNKVQTFDLRIFIYKNCSDSRLYTITEVRWREESQLTCRSSGSWVSHHSHASWASLPSKNGKDGPLYHIHVDKVGRGSPTERIRSEERVISFYFAKILTLVLDRCYYKRPQPCSYGRGLLPPFCLRKSFTWWNEPDLPLPLVHTNWIVGRPWSLVSTPGTTFLMEHVPMAPGSLSSLSSCCMWGNLSWWLLNSVSVYSPSSSFCWIILLVNRGLITSWKQHTMCHCPQKAYF